MIGFIKRYLRKVSKIERNVDYLLSKHGTYDLKNPKVLSAKILIELHANKPINQLREVEFQVFSQFGDDGIIQYLINKVKIDNPVFVEFGVENYTESNTRFLLINNNWSGLVIDGKKENIDFIKDDAVSHNHDLHCIHSFVTKENINQIIANFLSKGYKKDIGLLSIDIDGNDYWIWNEIDVINPAIVVTEYNSVFGADKAWTIPYEPTFYRLSAHSSYQYWGASLKAFCILATKKGYSFVGCNSAGNNAYFIRNDKLGDLKIQSVESGFVVSRFREDLDNEGERYNIFRRLDLLKEMPIYNVELGEIEKI